MLARKQTTTRYSLARDANGEALGAVRSGVLRNGAGIRVELVPALQNEKRAGHAFTVITGVHRARLPADLVEALCLIHAVGLHWACERIRDTRRLSRFEFSVQPTQSRTPRTCTTTIQAGLHRSDDPERAEHHDLSGATGT